ncbi:hypothetical protein EVAR_51680_1 [Eumeta japonica]|uniref:Uncharacterized protein n=1 Tax=Eumeta variegata TaxID=151549 RepID=A0A4C1Y718_EUMVA|nr:hypothetical protein EVAR_51680_1 [Eumeta japonica]
MRSPLQTLASSGTLMDAWQASEARRGRINHAITRSAVCTLARVKNAIQTTLYILEEHIKPSALDIFSNFTVSSSRTEATCKPLTYKSFSL